MTKSVKEIQKNMEFRFCSPGVMNVCVAGEFNDWDTQSLPMKKHEDGVWRSTVELVPGRYEYKLFADNSWVEDLPNCEAVLNPFVTKTLSFQINRRPIMTRR